MPEHLVADLALTHRRFIKWIIHIRPAVGIGLTTIHDTRPPSAYPLSYLRPS